MKGFVMESSLNDISQLIRVKEKELHEIHDQRCHQLELLISERDSLLIDYGKRFEQLKDDFQYNLALLEARDQEIRRLEGYTQNVANEIIISENKCRILQSRIETLETKEAERFEKHEENKLANKRILEELKDVIESMRWASTEETRANLKEIDNLKQEVIRMNISREESLDIQRRDLTNTFEVLVHQREESFSLREREIGHQVNALNQKFEHLHSENSRLRTENSDLLIKTETAADDVLAKRDQVRQLQWKLDDERVSKLHEDDQRQRHVQQLNAEVLAVREKAVQEAAELSKAVDKVKKELEREHELRLNIEQAHSRLRIKAEEDVRILNSDVASSRKLFDDVTQQNAELRSEIKRRDISMNSSQSEIEKLSSRNRSMQVENESLEVLVRNSRVAHIEAEDKIAVLENVLRNVTEELSSARQTISVNLAAAVTAAEDAQRAAEAHSNEKDAFQHNLHRFQDLENALQDEHVQRNDLNEQLKTLSDLYEEERMESKALKLRLTIQGNQALGFRHRIQGMEIEQHKNEAFSFGLAVGAGVVAEDIEYSSAGNNGTLPFYPAQSYDTEGRLGVSSLVFSEDYGPVSPVDSQSSSSNKGYQKENSTKSDQSDRFENNQHRNSPVQHQQQQLGARRGEASSMREIEQCDEDSAVRRENDRLKLAIREMRLDVEALKHQVSNQSHRGDGLSPPENQVPQNRSGRSMYEDKLRLEQTVAEVARLRSERTRLMDVGNELRAELNRKISSSSVMGSGPLPSSLRAPHSDPYGNNDREELNGARGYRGGEHTQQGDDMISRNGPHIRQPNSQDQSHGVTSFQTQSANFPGIRGVSIREGTAPVPPSSSTNLPYPPSHIHDSHRSQQSYGDHYGDTGRYPGISGLQQPSLTRNTVRPPRAETSPTSHQKRTSAHSSAIPSGLTNSNRATMSQVNARRRIQQNQLKAAIEENLPRKVFNYSKGDEDDNRAERD